MNETRGFGLGALNRPIWLDVRRLVTRVGRGSLSGIDRVEFAYLEHCLSNLAEPRFLCRSTRGYLLLSRGGGAALLELARGAPLGAADVVSRLTGRGGRSRHRVEAALRPHALDRATPWGLARMIRKQGGAGALYLNTGHANLAQSTLVPLAAEGVEIVALIHDLIPATHPHLVPPEQPARFVAKIETVAATAALVISNSNDTTEQLDRFWRDRAERPHILTASIGIPMADVAPQMGALDRFAMIGTIEPRKNHVVILEAFDLLAAELPANAMPQLHIVVAQGWQGGEIIARIRAHPGYGKYVFYHGPLADEGVSEHLHAAGSLLYPTYAEGFGLPPWEALAHGTMPICSDLLVLKELLGERAVYLNAQDVYSWAETIKKRISGTLVISDRMDPQAPTWQEHFERVAAALATGPNRRKGRR